MKREFEQQSQAVVKLSPEEDFKGDFGIMLNKILFIILTVVLSAGAIFGQTSSFTYQGRLTDGGTPANGNYDLQFALFDAAGGSNQVGQTQTISNVAVSGGVFTVTLDFGANAFSGASRFMEISARPSGSGAFTLLTPRQPITSTPYAVRSLNTATADTATNAQQLGGVGAGQYVKTDDTRLSDQRDPKPAARITFKMRPASRRTPTSMSAVMARRVGRCPEILLMRQLSTTSVVRKPSACSAPPY